MAERVFKMKICLLGEPAVGKTSLINQFVINKFDDKYISTLGTKVSKKDVNIKINGEDIRVTLMIWDVLGQSQFKNVLASALKGARGALIVCDITRHDTFKTMKDWIGRLFGSEGTVPIVLLANKSDLKDKYQVKEEELKALADQYNCPYYITSAKTGDHVEEAFHEIAFQMVKHALGIPTAKRVGDEKSDLHATGMDIFGLEDKIIAEFCEVMGGQDFAMPIVRQQFKRVNMDFREPTLAGLKLVVGNLSKIVKDFKSPDEARDLERKLRHLIAEYEAVNGKE